MQIKQLNTFSDKQDTLIPFYKESINTGLIQELTGVKNPDFEGRFKEWTKLYNKNGNRIYLLGLGEEKHSNRSHESFKSFAFNNKENWPSVIQIVCNHLTNETVANAILGLQFATYDIGSLKSESQNNTLLNCDFEVDIVGLDSEVESLNEAIQTGESVNRMKSLIDTPSNIKTPDYLASWAKASAEKYGYDCQILEIFPKNRDFIIFI